jgi:hypothetical protein
MEELFMYAPTHPVHRVPLIPTAFATLFCKVKKVHSITEQATNQNKQQQLVIIGELIGIEFTRELRSSVLLFNQNIGFSTAPADMTPRI